jgi:hypothetical protein
MTIYNYCLCCYCWYFCYCSEMIMQKIRFSRKATRFVPKAWIISTLNQPSWLCSTCLWPSWKRRWETGWVSGIIWQYSGMLRSVYSKLLPTFRKTNMPSFLDWFNPKMKSLKSFETSVYITNWHRITLRKAWLCTHTALRQLNLASSYGYNT